jgi:hypothetical protein
VNVEGDELLVEKNGLKQKIGWKTVFLGKILGTMTAPPLQSGAGLLKWGKGGEATPLERNVIMEHFFFFKIQKKSGKIR